MKKILPSSFRDPSGFLFTKSGKLYRQINKSYKKDFDLLISSGLYDVLTAKALMVPHKNAPDSAVLSKKAYKIILPEIIAFISYPYEWSFSQFKDAALTTLKIQKLSLEHGMSLKDASAYNVQFKKCKPIFIDTLSFEEYKEGEPWVAYKQFCQHFLAPLALMAYRDIRLSTLMRLYIDGIPLDLASKLLPLRSYSSIAILSHIHLHARSQKIFEDKKVTNRKNKISKTALKGIISNLESAVNNLKWKPRGTVWSDYYHFTNYSKSAFNSKKKIVTEMLSKAKVKQVWDLGANTGEFSFIAANKGTTTISFDSDPATVEKLYLNCRKKNNPNILPLVTDLTNPSPRLGWANSERMSFSDRGPTDCILALALIHHLAISNNVPLGTLADFFASNCKYLIIEFIPKKDSQVQKLLRSREDIFEDYNKNTFEAVFSRFFKINYSKDIRGSARSLYLMEKK